MEKIYIFPNFISGIPTTQIFHSTAFKIQSGKLKKLSHEFLSSLGPFQDDTQILFHSIFNKKGHIRIIPECDPVYKNSFLPQNLYPSVNNT